MALLKSVTFQKEALGAPISGNYWTITNISYNKQIGKTNIIIELFANEAERQSGLHKSISRLNIQFAGGAYTLEELYAKIKQDERFSDAKDC